MSEAPRTESRRRLWRIDLDDVEVLDESGRAYNVTATRGVLDGALTVTITSEDVPLGVAEALADVLEVIVQHGGKLPAIRALEAYRAKYPKGHSPTDSRIDSAEKMP